MSGVVRFVAGIALMFVGIFTGNLALAKAGYYVAMSGLVEEVTKLFLPKPPKMRMRQDIEYAGTVEPRRIIYGQLRVGGMNTIRPLIPHDGRPLRRLASVTPSPARVPHPHGEQPRQ